MFITVLLHKYEYDIFNLIPYSFIIGIKKVHTD
jgi:hypothetical protein